MISGFARMHCRQAIRFHSMSFRQQVAAGFVKAILSAPAHCLLCLDRNRAPLTASSIEPLKRLHQEFGRDIGFVTVNVREAHPGENYRQPMNYEQKLEHARDLQKRYEIPWIVAVDDMDGTLHRALDAKPNAAFLMDKNGEIAFRTLFAGDVTSLEQALRSVSKGGPTPKKASRSMLKPMSRAIGFIHGILEEAGPQAQRDMLRVAPPLVMAAKIASLFQFLTQSQRGAAAVATIAFAMAVMVAGGIGILI